MGKKIIQGTLEVTDGIKLSEAPNVIIGGDEFSNEVIWAAQNSVILASRDDTLIRVKNEQLQLYRLVDPQNDSDAATKGYVDSQIPTKVSELSDNADYVKYNSVLMPTNPFGGKGVYINSIDNALFAADKKFYVTVTRHKKVIDNITYPYEDPHKTITDDDYFVDSPSLSTEYANTLFDGSYEGGLTCASDEYMKVRIMFGSNTSPSNTTSYQPGYPYGTFYLSYYYDKIPSERSHYRVYNKYTPHTLGWEKINTSVFCSTATTMIEEVIDEANYQRTCIEFIVFGGPNGTSLTEIDWKLMRPDLASSSATVTKFGPQSVYSTFGWYYNHIKVAAIEENGNVTFKNVYPINNEGNAYGTYGSLGNTTAQWENAFVKYIYEDGTLLSNKYQPKGNYATTDDVQGSNQQNIPYIELRNLRDNGLLVPGRRYRIIDYFTFTAQENTSSAMKPFDIIVTADDESSLNELASVTHRGGDDPFINNNLEAWEIKYCLDNDTNRFAWASAYGLGVIYWMKDEWGNEAPYDFKNIQFIRKLDSEGALDLDNGTDTWCYTFGGKIDRSIYQEGLNIYRNNIIGDHPQGINCGNTFLLSDNVFLGTSQCMTKNNILGSTCRSNTFGDNCQSNTFGNDCCYNTFGGCCYENTFGNGCTSNTFGDDCNYNIFGDCCLDNIFGDICASNTFGDNFQYNTFRHGCDYNTFGNYCKYNTFGNYCSSNTFGNNCQYIAFGASSSTVDYCRYNIIDNGCSYLYINSTDTSTSPSNQLQNVHVHLGVKGGSSENRLVIEVPDRNLQYEYNVVKAATTTIEV